MSDDAERAAITERVRRFPGIRSVPRPTESGVGFDLHYVRPGDAGGIPLLIVPGGPGLSSIGSHEGVRRLAVRFGFDVAMVEHRGVGLSRVDHVGADLSMDDMTLRAVVDDLVAVLDSCGWEQAVVLGSSYGGYVAQLLAILHPQRVSGLVLDSPMEGPDSEARAREQLRELFWHGRGPDTAELAEKVRDVVARGLVPEEETGQVVQIAYEFGGAPLLGRLLDTVRAGRMRSWRWLAKLGNDELEKVRPHAFEFDLVGAIWYRELCDIRPDGGPLDRALLRERHAARYPAFVGPPMDVSSARTEIEQPTAVLSGARDMRCVRPSLVRMADALPNGELLPFDSIGHSFLTIHPKAALTAAGAVAKGRHRQLPSLVPRLERMRRNGPRQAFEQGVGAWIAAEHALARVGVA